MLTLGGVFFAALRGGVGAAPQRDRPRSVIVIRLPGRRVPDPRGSPVEIGILIDALGPPPAASNTEGVQQHLGQLLAVELVQVGPYRHPEPKGVDDWEDLSSISEGGGEVHVAAPDLDDLSVILVPSQSREGMAARVIGGRPLMCLSEDGIGQPGSQGLDISPRRSTHVHHGRTREAQPSPPRSVDDRRATSLASGKNGAGAVWASSSNATGADGPKLGTVDPNT